MKIKPHKTKIIRVRGGEIYFERIETDEGLRWLPYTKDTSALCAAWQDKRFKVMNYWSKTPTPIDPAIIPIPENYATDLLGPYAKLEYAKGHEPIKSFRMR